MVFCIFPYFDEFGYLGFQKYPWYFVNFPNLDDLLVFSAEMGVLSGLLVYRVPTGRLYMVLYALFYVKMCTLASESSSEIDKMTKTRFPCSR